MNLRGEFILESQEYILFLITLLVKFNFFCSHFLEQLIFLEIFSLWKIWFDVQYQFGIQVRNHIFQLLTPSIKWWIKIPKNALNVFIKMQMSIEFQLIHHKSLQPSSCYYTWLHVSKRHSKNFIQTFQIYPSSFVSKENRGGLYGNLDKSF